MEKIEFINAVQKGNSIIASCTNCVQLENAENYLQNFKQQTNNEEYYEKLILKLKKKIIELNCE